MTQIGHHAASRSDVDLPDFERNTVLAKAKMTLKSVEKGNTWRMSPVNPFLFFALKKHVDKVEAARVRSDLKAIVDGSLDCINYLNMIIDNAMVKLQEDN